MSIFELIRISPATLVDASLSGSFNATQAIERFPDLSQTKFHCEISRTTARQHIAVGLQRASCLTTPGAINGRSRFTTPCLETPRPELPKARVVTDCPVLAAVELAVSAAAQGEFLDTRLGRKLLDALRSGYESALRMQNWSRLLSVTNLVAHQIAMDLESLPIQAESCQILSQAVGVVGDLLRLP